jgi:hypothetical protein
MMAYRHRVLHRGHAADIVVEKRREADRQEIKIVALFATWLMRSHAPHVERIVSG